MQYSCINSIFSLLCMWTSYYYYVIYLMINDWHNVHQKETWIHLTFFHPLALAILLKGLRRPCPLTFLNVQIHHLNYINRRVFQKMQPPPSKMRPGSPMLSSTSVENLLQPLQVQVACKWLPLLLVARMHDKWHKNWQKTNTFTFALQLLYRYTDMR